MSHRSRSDGEYSSSSDDEGPGVKTGIKSAIQKSEKIRHWSGSSDDSDKDDKQAVRSTVQKSKEASSDRDKSYEREYSRRYSGRKQKQTEEKVSRNQLGSPEDREGRGDRNVEDNWDRRQDSRRRDRGRSDRNNRQDFDDYYHRDLDREKRRQIRHRDRDREDTKREQNTDEDKENKRKRDQNSDEKTDTGKEPLTKKAKNEEEVLTTRTGGAYIPPARLRMMQAAITDKASEEYQRISWEALKKSLNGLINKVNVGNIIMIVRELFQENIVRGRGLLSRSIVQAQSASPSFTHVYAALTAIINSKFPQIGELLLKRLIIQFKRGFRRNNKEICLTATRFIAHLVNQQVAHEVISLEILTLLLENATDDSVEITVGFLKECGQKLTEVSPRGIHAIFERLRSVLHESSVSQRVQYMIEVMFAVRKDGFKDHVAVEDELDKVEENDQYTHLLTLDEAVNGEDILNVFKVDPEFAENEEKYKTIKTDILEGDSSDSDASGSGSDNESDSDESENEEGEKMEIIDQTETNLVALRRTIYLTIQSSLDFEEAAHKLLKMELKPGQENELMAMILDCCAQMRTYEKFFGLLAQRFCMIDKKYVAPCESLFQEQYETCHRLETNKLRNVSRFFAHLLFTDAISWGVMQYIKVTEDDTTSSSRIFIKIFFQELSEFMGLSKLNERLKDVTLQEFFDGLFPKDTARNARFAINFFTTIGLGGLTDDLRETLKSMPKTTQQPVKEETAESSSDSSSSDSSSDSDSSDSSGSGSGSDSSSDSSSSSGSSSSSSSSEDEKKKRKKRTNEKLKVNRKDQQNKDRPEGQQNKGRPEGQQNKGRQEGGQSRNRDRNDVTSERKSRRDDRGNTREQSEKRNRLDDRQSRNERMDARDRDNDRRGRDRTEREEGRRR